MVRSRQQLPFMAHWVAVLIGLAALLDVLWIASRMQSAHPGAELVSTRPAAADVDRTGPPSLHMHAVY